MKLSKSGRIVMASLVSLALGLGFTACGSDYTAGFLYTTTTGTNNGQISAYKISHNTGKLTPVPKSPFSSGGSNPVESVIVNGGTFMYVLNAGSATIVEFSIGGNGVLGFQQSFQSQGSNPVALVADSSGKYLYVLDQNSPDGSTNGDITAFSINQSTGRLSLITNQNLQTSTGTQLTYFPVGSKPTIMRVAGGYIYTLNSGSNTLSPYQINSTNGQLTLTQNSTLPTGAILPTAMNPDVSGKYLYIADGSPTLAAPLLYAYTIGTNGVLQAVAQSPFTLSPNLVNPSYMYTNNNTKVLYVASGGPNLGQTQVNSYIDAYSINSSNGELQELSGAPYPSGSGPTCLIEDPSNQYLYASNYNDSTVTSYIINSTTGELRDTTHGASFAAAGQATCLVVTGRTS